MFLDFGFEALCWGDKKKSIYNRERQRVVVE